MKLEIDFEICLNISSSLQFFLLKYNFFNRLKLKGSVNESGEQHVAKTINDHNYAINMRIKPVELKCPNCDYTCDRRHRLATHCAEHCISKPKKESLCLICGKRFTHNGLRAHLRNFMNSDRASRGIHSRFSIEHHVNLLKAIVKTRK